MRLSCSKVTFENGAALKKPVLFQKKFKEKKFKKKERIIMQLFSADAVVFSKKIEFFFVPKNRPLKLFVICPQLFYALHIDNFTKKGVV